MKKETNSNVKTEKSVPTTQKEQPPHRKALKYFVASGVLVLALVGAGIAFYLKEDKAPVIVKTQPKTSPQEIIVATVGSDKITLLDLEKVKNSVPQLKNQKIDGNMYNYLLDAMINDRIMLAAAQAEKLQDDAEVKTLIENNTNLILKQAYIARKLKEKFTPEKQQEIYQAILKEIPPEDEIHARHILVDTEKEAKDIIVKLKAGANFAELANKYSKDTNPNANNGGDLGYFKKGMMIPDFANPAFAIKKGHFSEKPVKTTFGWHVIKVEDRRPAPMPAPAVIADVIQAKFTEQTLPVVVQEERQKANVILLDPLGLNKKEALIKQQQKQKK